MLLALMVWSGTLAMALWSAVQQPWLGISTEPAPDVPGLRIVRVWPQGPAASLLAEGEVLTALGPAEGEMLMLQQQDLQTDPDVLPTFAGLEGFLARQDDLAAALSAPVTRLVTRDGRQVTLAAGPRRPSAALPLEFWVYHLYGFIALLVGGWVWSRAHSRPAAGMLLASGLGFVILTASASILATRHVALPAADFRWLLAGYHLGNNLFAIFVIGLLWHYPGRLGGRPLYWLLVLWVAYAWLNERWQWHDLPGSNAGFQVAVLTVTGIAVMVAQWRRSRRRPGDRAVVRFLALSVLLLNVLAVALYYHAQWLGVGARISLVGALGIVMCFYLALVFGVLRYRLFDIDRWWAYLWLWIAAAVAIIGLDVLISLSLSGLSQLSLAIALLLVGFVYFPFRQWLWQQAFPDPAIATLNDRLPPLVLELVSGRGQNPDAAWRRFLEEVFLPLQTEESAHAWPEPRLLAAGERLYVPGVRAAGCELCLAQHGRRLFGRRDLQLVAALHGIVVRLDAGLDGYRLGMVRERERIMRDLHDDVGGRLLTLVHECEGQRAGRIAREALDALRDVIYFSMDTEALIELPDVIGRWRHQLRERLGQQGVALDWAWDADAMEGCSAAGAQIFNIARILQEAVSNALRHARPGMVRVHGRVVDGRLLLTITNDGVRTRASGSGGGRGLANMRQRATEMGGSLTVETEGDLFRVALRAPLLPKDSG